MPLIGTICCQSNQPTLFSVCEGRCREGACQHPLPLLVNMRKNAARREGISVSASVLGGCPRQYLLGRTTDYYENPEDYYARWFGSFGHYAIEMDGPYPGVIQETRFYRSIVVDGQAVEISGQPDWVDTQAGLISDHKMTSYKPREPKQEHIQQLNVYRWLVEGGWKSTPHLDRPRIQNIFINKLEVRYYHPGKNGRHTEFEIPIWSDKLVEAYIQFNVTPLLADDPMSVGMYGKNNEWRANYCPFRHTGQCCMLPA